jgi:hypothetical protein
VRIEAEMGENDRSGDELGSGSEEHGEEGSQQPYEDEVDHGDEDQQ